MSKFPLLSDYVSILKEKPIQKSNKIKYQEYIIEVENEETSVYIPIRESENFENVIESLDHISIIEIKKLMREFRGIRNRNI